MLSTHRSGHSMYWRAQTNVQLFAQLRNSYDEAELLSAFRAYELAARLFSGRYRNSGNTFISHLVGTASVLASVGAPMPVVAAGLLHAAYPAGDFGTWSKGVSPAKREEVRSAVGDDVERYVQRFAELPWNRQSIAALAARVDMLGPTDRNVVLMQIANWLDVHLDRGILYYVHADQRRAFFLETAADVATIAQRLAPSLARELEAVGADLAGAEIPRALRAQWRAERLLVPRSCRRRVAIAWGQHFESLRSALRLRSRLREWGLLGRHAPDAELRAGGSPGQQSAGVG